MTKRATRGVAGRKGRGTPRFCRLNLGNLTEMQLFGVLQDPKKVSFLAGFRDSGGKNEGFCGPTTGAADSGRPYRGAFRGWATTPGRRTPWSSRPQRPAAIACKEGFPHCWGNPDVPWSLEILLWISRRLPGSVQDPGPGEEIWEGQRPSQSSGRYCKGGVWRVARP